MQNFTFHKEVSEDSQGKKTQMIFAGYLTLQNARQIKDTLQNQSWDYKSVELMAHDVKGIDVSFLQILESFRKSIEDKGHKAKILMDLPYDLKTIMANAGIVYPVK